jgi:hypothetical protein
MSMTTRREKIIYFSLALILFMLFRHMLGPLLGLSGLMLTAASYAFAILLATVYLYKTLLRPARLPDEKDTG